MEGGTVEKVTDADAPPVLSTKETSRTIQRCLFLILSRHQLGIGEVTGRSDGTAERKPPCLSINWTRRISDPTGSGESIASVASNLTRAGEAPLGSGQIQGAFGELLPWPECRTAKKQDA